MKYEPHCYLDGNVLNIDLSYTKRGNDKSCLYLNDYVNKFNGQPFDVIRLANCYDEYLIIRFKNDEIILNNFIFDNNVCSLIVLEVEVPNLHFLNCSIRRFDLFDDFGIHSLTVHNTTIGVGNFPYTTLSINGIDSFECDTLVAVDVIPKRDFISTEKDSIYFFDKETNQARSIKDLPKCMLDELITDTI